MPAAALSLDAAVTLRRGAGMPVFGLGTWLSEHAGGNLAQGVGAPGGGDTTRAVLRAALRAGYRLIDTAAMYENEVDVGAAVRESGLPRGEVFVTTKLKPAEHADPAAALRASLARLGLDHVDLYLIHMPSGLDVANTWRTMLSLRDAGLARAVGVSNFGAAQLAALAALGLEAPEVNQIELHLWNQQREAVEYCRAHGVFVQGYCPLARCLRIGQNAAVAAVTAEVRAAGVDVTEHDVAVRWSLQRGFGTIPKSSSPARVAANAARAFSFELSAAQMRALAAADEGFFASRSALQMALPFDEVNRPTKEGKL